MAHAIRPYRWYIRGRVGAPTPLDVLDRVLDRGIVIDGDIRVHVGGIRDLVAVQFRWVACSIGRAEEIGMDWWPSQSGDAVFPRRGDTVADEEDAGGAAGGEEPPGRE